MTFAQLKIRVMERMKLSTTEAADRVGRYLNERYRAVATSVGMTAVRFGSVSLNTVALTADYSPATLIHPITVVYPGGSWVLPEKTEDWVRNVDPAGTRTGRPEVYVVKKFNATTVTLSFWPTPDAIYALTIDGILTGTDMSADGDVPVLPEDFHDTLIFGACADELMKIEKETQSLMMEKKFEKRLGECRYFIAKTAYLDFQQGDSGYWWWGGWFHNYRGFQ